jgi:GTPase SAR1 family protein
VYPPAGRVSCATDRASCRSQVDNPTSLENVETKWIEEIIELCPGVKIALVALKCDLRDDPTTRGKLAKQSLQPCEYEEVSRSRPHTLGSPSCPAITTFSRLCPA